MSDWSIYDNPGDEFIAQNGPLWMRIVDGRREYAFRPRKAHSNPRGVVHGGMLAAFADVALGHPCWLDHGGTGPVTAQLSLSFLSAAKEGELVTCRTEIVRKTRSMYFPRGDIMQGSRCVATATGVWKIAGAS